ncbi:MATE family efflux transporter [Mangrovibacterium marinum]|uniref:Multidrug-efflux transporter n=1 Tax=Mangrovibacterium marinum TaxID=1639118 RepID=A0A2T5C0F2_9BACT|nr:MATE family efflux transporter [Mangrovibacterium marinum]PTN08027.1 MATE family multidrug resistance protein [Mangrovibacterium marinum]
MALQSYIPFYKKTLKLAFPVILSQVGQITVALVDNMMVGHAGTTELAAASFSNSIFLIGVLLGMGIAMGLTPLVGKYYSQKNNDEVAALLKNGFVLHSFVAAALVVIMSIVALFLGRMGQPEEVVRLSYPYFMVLVASLVPMLLFYSLKQFLEGLGNTKVAMMITLSSNLVNLIFNYLLIFGKFGFPALGLLGAGIATFIARLFMPFLIIAFMRRHALFSSFIQAALQLRPDRAKIKQLLGIGMPIGIQIVIEVLTFSVGAVMMGWLGTEQLAAHQIAISMASFTYMISLGVGAASTILVSHEYGLHNYVQIRKMVSSALHLIVLFMFSMGILFILLRGQLPHLFTKDSSVIPIAATLLIIAAAFQVFDGIQVALLSVLRGMSDVRKPMILAFLSYSVIGLPVSYLMGFVFDFGAVGIWIGFLFGLAAAACSFAFRLRKLLFTA